MTPAVLIVRLVGPLFVAIGIGILLNAPFYAGMIVEAVHSPTLVYLSGVASLLAGLAILNAYRAWTANWRVIVTVLGWLCVIGGNHSHRAAAGHGCRSRPRSIPGRRSSRSSVPSFSSLAAISVSKATAHDPCAKEKSRGASMNKHIAESDLATPKVTTGPISGSRKIYATARRGARAESAAARDRARCLFRRAARCGLRSLRPLHRSRCGDRRRARSFARAPCMGERARRRRGIRRPRDQAGRQWQRLRQAPRAQFPQHTAPATRRLCFAPPPAGRGGRPAQSRPGWGHRRLQQHPTPALRADPPPAGEGDGGERPPSRNWNGRAPA